MADQPNIVLINCDDLGYGDLGCYGSTQNRTPGLDRLAAQGTRFDDFYMASSVCSPSRGAMMTGCYPQRVSFGTFDGQGVLFPGNGMGLNPEEQTVAGMLREAGYATAMVGKWHCGDQPEFLPTRHGFDHYYGIPFSNDMGRQPGRDHFPPLPLLDDERVIQQQPDQRNLIERYTEQSVRFLRANQDQPFFLYLAHLQVHRPLYSPTRFMEAAEHGRYQAAVEALDWSTSAIMHELAELDLEDNTLVIFTSDNGSRGDMGGSNGALAGRKGTTWEGGFRVPCIMRWPRRIPAGGTCEGLCSSLDFLPTFACLAGAQPQREREIDGVDLSPMLDDPRAGSPREMFFYYHRDRLAALRLGRWKLHVCRGEESVRELYDLEADVGETTNLADQHSQQVQTMLTHFEAMRDELGDAATQRTGKACRPIGRVDNPQPLTEYDASHPYIISIYDLPEAG